MSEAGRTCTLGVPPELPRAILTRVLRLSRPVEAVRARRRLLAVGDPPDASVVLHGIHAALLDPHARTALSVSERSNHGPPYERTSTNGYRRETRFRMPSSSRREPELGPEL